MGDRMTDEQEAAAVEGWRSNPAAQVYAQQGEPVDAVQAQAVALFAPRAEEVPPTADDAAVVAALLREVADGLEQRTPAAMRWHVGHLLTPTPDGEAKRLRLAAIAIWEAP